MDSCGERKMKKRRKELGREEKKMRKLKESCYSRRWEVKEVTDE